MSRYEIYKAALEQGWEDYFTISDALDALPIGDPAMTNLIRMLFRQREFNWKTDLILTSIREKQYAKKNARNHLTTTTPEELFSGRSNVQGFDYNTTGVSALHS